MSEPTEPTEPTKQIEMPEEVRITTDKQVYIFKKSPKLAFNNYGIPLHDIQLSIDNKVCRNFTTFGIFNSDERAADFISDFIPIDETTKAQWCKDGACTEKVPANKYKSMLSHLMR